MTLKFKVIFNEKKDWARKTAGAVEAFLKSKKQRAVPENEDISIIIGGDGTIFYHKEKIHGAVFGIGGPQSKVCQANSQDWKPMLGKILNAKKLPVEERTALSVKINGKGVGWAINDAVVHARRHNFVEIVLKIRSETHEFGGDGVIVSTPTGAGGYAYSAGGFNIDKANFLVEVVPICPYMRTFRPQLAPVASEIEIMHKGAADLVIDGQRIIELDENDIVSVCGDRIVNFIEV